MNYETYKKLLSILLGSGGLSLMLIYIIVGCSILVLTGASVVFVFVCCRQSPDSPDGKKGYIKIFIC